MRAYELYEGDLEMLGIKRDGSGDQQLTLKNIHKLKLIRARRKIEREQKLKLVGAMYGNQELKAQRQDMERAQAELDIKRQELELEYQAFKQSIELQIEKAKLSDAAKDKVSAMAKEALGRRLKEESHLCL